jgi:hypothetical protein
VRWGGVSKLMWRQVKYTVGGSSALTITTDTHVYTGKKDDGRPSIYIILHRSGVDDAPLLAVVGLCVLLLCIIRTRHTHFSKAER